MGEVGDLIPQRLKLDFEGLDLGSDFLVPLRQLPGRYDGSLLLLGVQPGDGLAGQLLFGTHLFTLAALRPNRRLEFDQAVDVQLDATSRQRQLECLGFVPEYVDIDHRLTTCWNQLR